MARKRNLRRIHLQSGCTDRMKRPIDGVFEVLLDDDDVVNQMEQAYKNKGRVATCGGLVVIYHPCSKAQADYIVAHPEACGIKLVAGPLVDEAKTA